MIPIHLDLTCYDFGAMFWGGSVNNITYAGGLPISWSIVNAVFAPNLSFGGWSFNGFNNVVRRGFHTLPFQNCLFISINGNVPVSNGRLYVNTAFKDGSCNLYKLVPDSQTNDVNATLYLPSKPVRHVEVSVLYGVNQTPQTSVSFGSNNGFLDIKAYGN